MEETNEAPVVVAVGDEDCEAALAFAGQEASRTGCGVHLLHVAPAFVHGSDSILVQSTDVEEVGRRTLHLALEHARDVLPPSTAITSELLVGGIVDSLREATADAPMVVVQHRDLSRMRRLVTRSVTNGLGAHARVPIVSVPSWWSPRRAPGQEPRVTVGVDVPVRSEQVLRTAVAAAQARGATLHALHAWKVAGIYDDITVARTLAEAWAERAGQEVRAALEALGPEAAGAPLVVETRHGPAAEALVEASRSSDLLVVGRHDPMVPLGSHLGPVARGVLHESHCPVLLVDPHSRTHARP
ncbi:Universal stress protein [Nocardioides dokdonensis FR1436]|uniref:Universal stress protein n=1 Tax=Nocardioides dokdonensis FR1436 TaxID=1300347 RepID=A0A1A9GPW0_9ACTN|nr:universal stress protein [Nocardioides dokdonensis]ANH39633.1 Universal stress protein [Nocardioides dokdonensis FR1436]